jgi:hypothetical protein
MYTDDMTSKAQSGSVRDEMVLSKKTGLNMVNKNPNKANLRFILQIMP